MGIADDKKEIEQLYHSTYRAMIEKNRSELLRQHDESFVLYHMTGMQQDRDEYVNSIMNGTLNYYSEKTENIDISMKGDSAILIGQSRVTAAVFGGGKHTWRLQLKFNVERQNDGWKLTSCRASTY